MSDSEPTEPVEDPGDTGIIPDTEVEDDLSAEAEVEDSSETDIDEFGNPVEPVVADFEFGGQTFTGITAQQQEAIEKGSLMHRDYTVKTQALAEEKRQLAAVSATQEQLSQAEVDTMKSLLSVEGAEQRYKNIDWAEWYRQDPQAAQAERFSYDRVKEQGDTLRKGLEQATAQRRSHEAQVGARLRDEGLAELRQAIPDWSDDMARSIVVEGQKNYGFTQQELLSESDPRVVRALKDANSWRKQQSKQRAVKKVTDSATVKPATTVRSGKGTVKGLHGKMTTDEWINRRNAQISNRKR